MFVKFYDIQSSLYSYRSVAFLNTCLAATYRTTPSLLGSNSAQISEDFQSILALLDQFTAKYKQPVKQLKFAPGSSHRSVLKGKVTFLTIRDGHIIYEFRDKRTQNYIVFTYILTAGTILIDNIFGRVPDLEQLIEYFIENYPKHISHFN